VLDSQPSQTRQNVLVERRVTEEIGQGDAWGPGFAMETALGLKSWPVADSNKSLKLTKKHRVLTRFGALVDFWRGGQRVTAAIKDDANALNAQVGVRCLCGSASKTA
jgi:hypothetical protein